eukprot:NODE_1127_length_1646_cov_33.797235_g1060_i0.p1 GENE.NODE_1127_length_1646_cov_33.797235_g1060_i0~~NODE_1127_length_1646_cov_33.797235_g1060_i0.p1  ORF type:complete len:385 (+),score=116.58 NODE_1127_length_1646_cov_33.797235_g1060_i0:246-1400(+)
MLTLGLTSVNECYQYMRRPEDGAAVTIANPQTKEFQICRVSLLPGLLKAMANARATPLPIKLFEVSDVVHKDATADVGVRNTRHCAALHCSTVSSFEAVHGLADHLMQMLGAKDVTIQPSADPAFFPGRQANVLSAGKLVGTFGVVHPEVLKRFVPLNKTAPVTGMEFVPLYQKDLHLSRYLHLIEPLSHYPLIRDAQGVVMSLPPIINSRHSQITLNTTNVLLEVTAVDEGKAHIMLNQVLAGFSLYCKHQFTVEPVLVQYEGGREVLCPDLSPRTVECSVSRINRSIGIDQPAPEMAKALTRMLLKAEGVGEDTIKVEVPVTRSDILHPCDVMEDVAIAYGYDNIHKQAPTTLCTAKQDPACDECEPKCGGGQGLCGVCRAA